MNIFSDNRHPTRLVRVDRLTEADYITFGAVYGLGDYAVRHIRPGERSGVILTLECCDTRVVEERWYPDTVMVETYYDPWFD